jgi:hypothetical protein
MSEAKKSDLTTLGEIEPNKPIRSHGSVVDAEVYPDAVETDVDPNVARKTVNKVAEDAASKGMDRQLREDPTVISK